MAGSTGETYRRADSAFSCSSSRRASCRVAARAQDDGEAGRASAGRRTRGRGRARGASSPRRVRPRSKWKQRQLEVRSRMVRLQLEGPVPLRQGRLVLPGGAEVTARAPRLTVTLSGSSSSARRRWTQALVDASTRVQVPAVPEVADGGARVQPRWRSGIRPPLLPNPTRWYGRRPARRGPRRARGPAPAPSARRPSVRRAPLPGGT